MLNSSPPMNKCTHCQRVSPAHITIDRGIQTDFSLLMQSKTIHSSIEEEKSLDISSHDSNLSTILSPDSTSNSRLKKRSKNEQKIENPTDNYSIIQKNARKASESLMNIFEESIEEETKIGDRKRTHNMINNSNHSPLSSTKKKRKLNATQYSSIHRNLKTRNISVIEEKNTNGSIFDNSYETIDSVSDFSFERTSIANHSSTKKCNPNSELFDLDENGNNLNGNESEIGFGDVSQLQLSLSPIAHVHHHHHNYSQSNESNFDENENNKLLEEMAKKCVMSHSQIIEKYERGVIVHPLLNDSFGSSSNSHSGSTSSGRRSLFDDTEYSSDGHSLLETDSDQEV